VQAKAKGAWESKKNDPRAKGEGKKKLKKKKAPVPEEDKEEEPRTEEYKRVCLYYTAKGNGTEGGAATGLGGERQKKGKRKERAVNLLTALAREAMVSSNEEQGKTTR